MIKLNDLIRKIRLSTISSLFETKARLFQFSLLLLSSQRPVCLFVRPLSLSVAPLRLGTCHHTRGHHQGGSNDGYNTL